MRVHDDWILTSERAAIHQPTRTAVVADCHLGYAEARQRAGEVVPVPVLESLLLPLAKVVTLHEVRSLVIAGDLFEAGPRPEVLSFLLKWCSGVGVELAVVPGNHDRGLEGGGSFALHPDGLVIGKWRIVHGDGDLPAGAVVHGHEHPCLRWGELAAPCYLLGPERLILPAFSSEAAGVNVCSQPGWRSYRCAVIVGEQVLDFGPAASLAQRLAQAKERGSAPRWPPRSS